MKCTPETQHDDGMYIYIYIFSVADALDFIDGGFASDDAILYVFWISFVVVITGSTVMYIFIHKGLILERVRSIPS
jgi:hypothetical protein